MTRRQILVRLAWVAAAVGFVVLVSFLPKHDVTLEEAIDNLRRVNAIHWEMVVDGERSESWIDNPYRLRHEYPDGTYVIHNGPDMWEVDPQANKAIHRPSHYYAEAERWGVEYVSQHGPRGSREPVMPSLVTSLLPSSGAKPTTQTTHDGRTMDLYSGGGTFAHITTRGEMLVDPDSRLLHSEEYWTNIGIEHMELHVLDYDQPMDDELFTFTPAPGMDVVEKPSLDWAAQRAK